MAGIFELIQALNQKIANDSNLQQSMVKFGAEASKPFDIRTGNPASVTLGALSGSMDHLNQLRQAEAAAKLRERAMAVNEGNLEVAQRGATVQERKATTDENESVQGNIPLKQAQAEYYRNRSMMERLRLQMEKATGRQKPFDKNLWEAAMVLSGEVGDYKDQKEWRKSVLAHYNQLGAVRGEPITPLPLADIDDEEILRQITDPNREKLFLGAYGTAGADRLNAVRKRAAAAQAAAQVKTKPTVTTPQSAHKPFELPWKMPVLPDPISGSDED